MESSKTVVKKREDIEVDYKDRKVFLQLSEHLQSGDAQFLIAQLSKYLFYRDHYVFLFFQTRLEYKKLYSALDYDKRTNLKNLEKQSVDSKGKPGFKVTEQMIKDEIHTDPVFVQVKKKEMDIRFLTNRLESAIECLRWKLQALLGGHAPEAVKIQLDGPPEPVETE